MDGGHNRSFLGTVRALSSGKVSWVAEGWDLLRAYPKSHCFKVSGILSAEVRFLPVIVFSMPIHDFLVRISLWVYEIQQRRTAERKIEPI